MESPVEIVAIVFALAVSVVGVALFARAVAAIVAVTRLGQPASAAATARPCAGATW